jgi:hypothetical protein
MTSIHQREQEEEQERTNNREQEREYMYRQYVQGRRSSSGVKVISRVGTVSDVGELEREIVGDGVRDERERTIERYQYRENNRERERERKRERKRKLAMGTK